MRNHHRSRALIALFLSLPFTAFARETVVEDTPGRLILEVEVDAYEARAAEGGTRIVAPGYGGASQTGAPDLPWLRFQVATGDRMPRVTLEPLEWTAVALPGGLAGVPKWITNKQPEAYKDPALFAAGGGLTPAVSSIILHRGLRLREVSLPLGSYAGGTSANLLKKFRVRVDFPNPGSAPFAGVKPWLEFAGVKNPSGGAYLTSIPRPTALRRSAATSQFDPGAAWIKITICDRVVDGLDKDGVYALTFDQLEDAGFPIGTDTALIRMFTGPKDTLTTRMDGPPLAPTLREIPIEIREGTTGGNPNGTFDAGDTILFYAHGTSIWKPIPGATGPVQWQFKNDPWSFENRYYLQWNSPGGLRLQTAAPVATGTTVTTAPHYLRAERDLNTGSCDPAGGFDSETGHAWYWHGSFGCAGGPGGGAPLMLSGSQVRASSWETLADATTDTVWFGMFTFDGSSDHAFSPRSGNILSYSNLGIPGAWYFKFPGTFGGQLLDSLRWNGMWPRFEGYTVRYMRALSASSNRVIFPALNGQRVTYALTDAAGSLRVLRVVDGVGTGWLALQPQLPIGATFTDSAGVDEDVTYHVFRAPLTVASGELSLEATATASGVIHNLRDGSIGGARQNPEYLIIAPTDLLPEAVQLRNYRENPDRLNPMVTSVVRIEDIYREWSGGRMSPVAVRDFLRWAVNRWGAGDTPGNLKYVLLFGDGHYDYRNIRNGTTGSARINHVPPFNWQDNTIDPKSTDDFYAVLDSGESWLTGNRVLSLGRVPVQTRDQSANYLAKVTRYEDPATAGEWRSRFLLVGDDDTQRGAADGAGCHTCQADGLGAVILAQDSGMRPEKLYLFDYAPNASFLKPEATVDLLNHYNRGVLFSTFFGHGAYNQLADEVLLKTNDGLSRLRNLDRNFFMTIFSCTVGRFDKLADEGMGEQFLRQKDYGAITTISASRETWASENSALGNAFSMRAFDSSESFRFVGDALRAAKSAVGTEPSHPGNKAKYVLQGEPVLVLNRPGLGLHLTSAPDTTTPLQALGCDSLSGRVTRGSGRGAVSVRIVSGDISKTYTHQGTPLTVQKRGQILFERTVPYVDSVFSLQYFLPKQVPFGDTLAKIQIFAWDSLELRESALLVSGLRIEGTASPSCLVNDQRGPRIAVTGCNAREAGEVDFPDKVKIGLPYCLQIAVSDTGGGVLAGDGPDQGVTVEVVGSIAPYQPQAGVDDLSLKTYQMPLSKQELAEGTHLLKISARDGFGNLTQRQITLQVTQDTTLRFVRAFNVPNPMKRDGTTFWFSTSLPVDEGGALTEPLVDRVRFHVRIFNQRGYLVREFRDAVSGSTRFDGRDAWGKLLANGVYFYDVTATWSESQGSPQGGRRVSRKNTLVISR